MSIIELERQLLHYSYDEFEQILDDEFIEFGTSGKKYNKVDQLNAIGKDAELTEVFFDVVDFQEKNVSDDVILATYKTINKLTKQEVLRSSLWRLNGDKWQLLFHQGTKI